MEGVKTSLTRFARGKRKRRKKRASFPTGSGLTAVPSGIKERTKMTTSNNSDCRDLESPARHNYFPTEEDIAYMDWLDHIHEYDGPPTPQPPAPASRRGLFFATLAAKGWSPKPKPTKLRPFWQTIQHALATIRCSRLKALPLHRRLSCLLFFAPGRYYFTAAILALYAWGTIYANNNQEPTHKTTLQACATIHGKPACDGHEWQKRQEVKARRKARAKKPDPIILPARTCNQDEADETPCNMTVNTSNTIPE